MNSGRSRRTVASAVLVTLGTLLTAACQTGTGQGPGESSETKSSSPPHGYVEGAEEAAEQQSRLVLADPETGAVRVLDLTTGRTTSPKPVKGVNSLSTDGRFAYLATDADTRVLDTGVWTVDHGDHVHYYRAKIRHVGALGQTAHVRADAALTAATLDDGSARLFKRAELEDGKVGTPRELNSSRRQGKAVQAAVPYQGHLLQPVTSNGRSTVEVLARDGKRVASLNEECPQPSGDAVTRGGVVFGCADGALLVREEDGDFSALKIGYEQRLDAKKKAKDFHHRPGSTTLVAKAGDEGVWVLDVTKRTWTLVPTGPVEAANTAGEGAPLLTLGSNGTLSAHDIESGERIASTKLLSTGKAKADDSADARHDAGHDAVIEIDSSRAYVNDPLARKVHEVDYNDDLRVARTFELDITPAHMVETGR